MCQFNNSYVANPKKVGDTIDAGVYARDSAGKPIKGLVYLKGYNPDTKIWKTFSQAVPDQVNAWAAMSETIITADMIGTWRMSWDAPDADGPGNDCGAGPMDLVISQNATPMFLTSDKISIQQGDTVTFTGIYRANELVNIFEDGIVRTHITQAICDSSGDFKAVVASFNLLADGQIHKIQACSAGGLGIFECSVLPDKSGYVYITVYPRLACTPNWHCITPLNGMESDGCGHTRENPACNPGSGNTPCSPGTTQTQACPEDPSKKIEKTCVEGSWITTQDECKDDTMTILAVVIVVLILILAMRK
jgi:hypothetical protein